ncbi:MAG: CoA transferase subunit A [Alphaproteobacteria bacterium]
MSDMILRDVDALAALVPNGASLAVINQNGGVAMAATRALIRRGVTNLHVIGVPTSGVQADMLIGAGCVAAVESGGVSLGEFGQAPNFVRAVKAGAIRVLDSTCPAMYAGLQAAEKGNPFMPLRGLIGSDIVKHRPDYKVIANPFPPHDPIVVLPAIKPDFGLFHVALADRFGNVWVGRVREQAIIAHAATETLVTCERLYDGNLMEDEALAPACLSPLYVRAIAVAPQGAWPLGLAGHYRPDDAHLKLYAQAAATEAGMQAYLAEHVFGRRAAE